jgi:hypothetical protein
MELQLLVAGKDFAITDEQGEVAKEGALPGQVGGKVGGAAGGIEGEGDLLPDGLDGTD